MRMNCSEYRELHSRYTAYPLLREVCETEEYEEWVEHFHDCPSCGDWNLGKRVEAAGRSVSEFPCVHIAYQVTQKCETHLDPHDCPDVLIVKRNRKYGIPVRDGGSAISEIGFCPWCGVDLSRMNAQ